jgi:hypothetical protein
VLIQSPHTMISLFAAALAVAGFDPALPAEFGHALGGVSFAALLASLPGTASAAHGLPILTACEIEWAMARTLARGIASRYAFASVQPILSRMKAMPSAENAARSLLSLP